MRLSWLVLAFAVIAVGWAEEYSSSTATAEDTTTTLDDNVETTTGAADGTTPTTTTKAAVTTTTKPPATAVSTTTKEPRPNVEDFSVKCDKDICTYSMQIPGLDIDTFNDLMLDTNKTETEVLDFEDNDLVSLQDGVDKVFSDAQATADYVQTELDAITQAISDLEVQSVTLTNDVNDLNTAVANANLNLKKILDKKGSCLYRQCILKETTTARPTTVTTVRTTPTPFCLKNKDVCGPATIGTCVNWYDSYYCTCTGNLDGQENNCKTSVCDVIKDAQLPGPVYSPGYNGTNNADDDCDGAQWTVKAKDASKVLGLVEPNFTDTKNNDCISNLSGDANLQLTVLKYKLKITSKTKIQQIEQILNYGAQATISYSGPAKDFFHFELKEIVPPTPTP